MNVTVVNIPDEKLACDLACELVRQGKVFTVERTPSGWRFTVEREEENGDNGS